MSSSKSFFTNNSIMKMSLIQLQMDAIACKDNLSKNSELFKENGGTRKLLITIESKLNKILQLPNTVSWGVLSSSFKSMRKTKEKLTEYDIFCK